MLFFLVFLFFKFVFKLCSWLQIRASGGGPLGRHAYPRHLHAAPGYPETYAHHAGPREALRLLLEGRQGAGGGPHPQHAGVPGTRPRGHRAVTQPLPCPLPAVL